MEEEQEVRHIRFCPHCGNLAPQVLRYTHRWHEEDWAVDGEPIGIPTVNFVVTCETCDGFLVYADWGDVPREDDFGDTQLLWPSVALHRSVPKTIAAVYNEAARIKRIAPNAFATQIRRALEVICEDRKAKQGSLAERLKDLAARGEIPPVLADLTHTLITLGNIGAHAAADSVRPWQVLAIDEFFHAIVEYIYVAPSKLNEFKKSLEEEKNLAKKESEA